jgi:hypothetical protein
MNETLKELRICVISTNTVFERNSGEYGTCDFVKECSPDISF